TQPSARSPGLSSSLQTCLRRISFPLSFLLRRISFLPRTISLLDLRLASLDPHKLYRFCTGDQCCRWRIWWGRTELFSIEAGGLWRPPLRCGVLNRPFSALGQKQTSRPPLTFSAFPPKADIGLTPAAGSRPQLRLPCRFEPRQLRSWRQSSVTDLTPRCSQSHTPTRETG